mmetsp:Transcript_33080/g.51403  ORF Transcript_33080/g.51403 Transcript_33080/m.51403 type:complete len:227 (+) Transcript_33080:1803-2483(+)
MLFRLEELSKDRLAIWLLVKWVYPMDPSSKWCLLWTSFCLGIGSYTRRLAFWRRRLRLPLRGRQPFAFALFYAFLSIRRITFLRWWWCGSLALAFSFGCSLAARWRVLAGSRRRISSLCNHMSWLQVTTVAQLGTFCTGDKSLHIWPHLPFGESLLRWRYGLRCRIGWIGFRLKDGHDSRVDSNVVNWKVFLVNTWDDLVAAPICKDSFSDEPSPSTGSLGGTIIK